MNCFRFDSLAMHFALLHCSNGAWPLLLAAGTQAFSLTTAESDLQLLVVTSGEGQIETSQRSAFPEFTKP